MDPKQAAVRHYTTYTLGAFKNLAISAVGKVTLKLGVNVSSEAGVSHLANAKSGCNTEITVKCAFLKKEEARWEWDASDWRHFRVSEYGITSLFFHWEKGELEMLR